LLTVTRTIRQHLDEAFVIGPRAIRVRIDLERPVWARNRDAAERESAIVHVRASATGRVKRDP
jgi:hypothetical protein